MCFTIFLFQEHFHFYYTYKAKVTPNISEAQIKFMTISPIKVFKYYDSIAILNNQIKSNQLA